MNIARLQPVFLSGALAIIAHFAAFAFVLN